MKIVADGFGDARKTWRKPATVLGPERRRLKAAATARAPHAQPSGIEIAALVPNAPEFRVDQVIVKVREHR
jgi:hypothetical protein